MAKPIWQMTATEIAAAVAGKKLSSVDVLDAVMARVHALNPSINAICTLNLRARDEAIACDERIACGKAARPLEGVPFVAKDNFDTAGIATTFGSLVFKERVPTEDAISVERLRSAGAVLIGKTNLSEMATDGHTTNRLFGTTRNPWDLERTAGGSSGGTAAAIAAGMAPIGLGTDHGGSIRAPASFNGIVGIRPTPGRVPIHPSPFAWDTLVEHVHGPMARSVSDAGLLLSLLAGPDDRDPSSLPQDGLDFRGAALRADSIAGRRILFTADFGGLVPMDPEVAAICRRAAYSLKEAGCAVEEGSWDMTGIREIIMGTRAFALVGRFADIVEQHREEMSLQIVSQVDLAMTRTLREVTKAEHMRGQHYQKVRMVLAEFNYIISPTVGLPAINYHKPLPTEVGGRALKSISDVFLGNYAISLTGLPVVTVPAGFTSEGLPVGMNIISRRLRDDLGLELAAAYEARNTDKFRMPSVDLSQKSPESREVERSGLKLT